ncbi:MAG TPA: hypothetical protein VKY31_09705, partial [Terriglobia bacterium]|nr:hypothetical protein [Terriglobia bacterium]
MSPSQAVQGATLNLTLTGSGFDSTTTITFSGTAAIVNGVRLINSTSLVANVTLIGDPATATISAGDSGGLPFEVLPSPLLNTQGAFVSQFNGSEGGIGTRDGIGTQARFYNPGNIWSDGTNLYVADTSASTIRKISIATGDVSTLAGSPGQRGNVDGFGSAARLNSSFLWGIWGDGANLYLSGCSIRTIVLATGEVSTLTGDAANCGRADGPPGVGQSLYGHMAGDSQSLYIVDPGSSVR